jgi:hypothetical protein
VAQILDTYGYTETRMLVLDFGGMGQLVLETGNQMQALLDDITLL